MRFQVVVWEREKVTSVFANDITNDFTIGKNKMGVNPRDFIVRAINISKNITQQVEEHNESDGIKFRIMYETESGIKEFSGSGYSREVSALMGLIKEFDPNEKEYKLYKENIRQSIVKKLSGEGETWL